MTKEQLREYFARAKVRAVEKKENELLQAAHKINLRQARALGQVAPKKPKLDASMSIGSKSEAVLLDLIGQGCNQQALLIERTGYSAATVRNGITRLVLRGLITQGPNVSREGKVGRKRFTFILVPPESTS